MIQTKNIKKRNQKKQFQMKTKKTIQNMNKTIQTKNIKKKNIQKRFLNRPDRTTQKMKRKKQQTNREEVKG